ncbi:MAG: ATP-binding cassette domain-containing protein [Actinobacteria bacterium]|uniref:Nickel import system ATP-binding protein NikD n=1 Tax=freshwater metagenome TaxID=449393 RepID=A0A6J6ULT2_9ZZZZ|nr:ATP-binding cassette domain-containing protein [Actinomycetota bacterium]
MSAQHLLEIRNLKIDVRVTRTKRLAIVDSASLIIEPGQIIGLIGESGSGKTMLCRSLVGTLGRRGAYIASGELIFDGIDLVTAKQSVWNDIRGKRIGYVPQSALAGPNPVMTIGAQLAEAIEQDKNFPKSDVEKRAIELLNIVQIRRPETVLKQYQHELSGGMKQRVMIACAIAQQPQLIVADEPTTGLDVTVQAEIMDLLKQIRKDFNTSIILVSHDLPLINEICDDIVVMHAGTTVEKIPSKAIKESRHPYTIALYNSRIDLVQPKGELKTINGQPPSVGSWPEGCRFSERCDFVTAACRVKQDLPLISLGNNHQSSCLRHNEIVR